MTFERSAEEKEKRLMMIKSIARDFPDVPPLFQEIALNWCLDHPEEAMKALNDAKYDWGVPKPRDGPAEFEMCSQKSRCWTKEDWEAEQARQELEASTGSGKVVVDEKRREYHGAWT